MNRNILYVGLVLCYLFSFHARGDDEHAVTINIAGNIVDTACTIGDDNMVVQMGTANPKGFDKFEPIDKIPFAIKLTDCPDSVQSATVVLSSVNDASSYVENQIVTADASIGFAIALYDYNDSFIDLKNNSTKFSLTNSVLRDFELNFKASFMKIADSLKSGCFGGVANFVIEYE